MFLALFSMVPIKTSIWIALGGFLLSFGSIIKKYSWLSRCSTWFVPVGPSKVKTRKSVLFTEGTPEVEIKNACLI